MMSIRSIVRGMAGVALSGSMAVAGLGFGAGAVGADPTNPMHNSCFATAPTVNPGPAFLPANFAFDAGPSCVVSFVTCPQPSGCVAAVAAGAATTSGPSAMRVRVTAHYADPIGMSGLSEEVTVASGRCHQPLSSRYPQQPTSCTTFVPATAASSAPTFGLMLVGYSATCHFQRVGPGGPVITGAAVGCELNSVIQ